LLTFIWSRGHQKPLEVHSGSIALDKTSGALEIEFFAVPTDHFRGIDPKKLPHTQVLASMSPKVNSIQYSSSPFGCSMLQGKTLLDISTSNLETIIWRKYREEERKPSKR